jgi:hypothetical protein
VEGEVPPVPVAALPAAPPPLPLSPVQSALESSPQSATTGARTIRINTINRPRIFSSPGFVAKSILGIDNSINRYKQKRQLLRYRMWRPRSDGHRD